MRLTILLAVAVIATARPPSPPLLRPVHARRHRPVGREGEEQAGEKEKKRKST